MKSIFTITMSCLASFCLAQETEHEIRSRISNVTVFLEGAQVTRMADVTVKQGISILSLKGISPSIHEQSIQVAGPSSVKILSVSFRVNYLNQIKKPEKISELENERRRLLGLIAQEKSTEEVFREEEVILKTNKSIGGSSKGVEIEELKIAMDYFRQRLTDIKQKLLQIDRNIRKHNEELGRIEAQLSELSNVKEKPTGEIIVKVSSKGGSHGNFSIKYLVSEARWFPSYDIRAKDVQSPISITYKANVNQQSGEDWENVELTISSGNPSEGALKPVIKPWFLGFNNSVQQRSSQMISSIQNNPVYLSANNLVRGRVTGDEGAGLPGVNVLIKGTSVGTVTDAEGFYSLPLTSDAQTLVFSFVGMNSMEQNINNRTEINAHLLPDVTALNEVIVTGYGIQQKKSITGSVSTIQGNAYGGQSSPKVTKTIVATPVVRQTNIEFTLDEPFSVKSDGEVRATEMVEYELDALYEYYCVPKLDEDAFLTAKVLNWDEYNFLEGEASLFFEGKYIGKSILDTRSITDTLTLSLGRDGNVLVKREKKKDYSSRQFVGANQKVVLSYEISIRNKKAQDITVLIADQIPVSNNKEIVVDKLDDSNGDYNNESGILKWKKPVTAGKTEMITLRYAIRYPKNSNIILE